MSRCGFDLFGMHWMSLLSLALAGCSGGGPDVGAVPVGGTITYNGKPLAGAQVSFVSIAENAKPTIGTTDDQGKYQLHTAVGGAKQVNGAIPGDYKVMVTKIDASGAKMPEFNSGGDSGEDAGIVQEDPSKMSDAKMVLPEKYGNVETSKLTATVKPSGNGPIDFALTD